MRIDLSWFCQDGRHVGDTAGHAGREGIVKFAFCLTCQETTKQTAERTGVTELDEGSNRIGGTGRYA